VGPVGRGELFSGAKTVPASETTVIESVGLVIEDLATARLVYDAVLTQGPRAGPPAGG
jgi:ornithine cyclodeaminase/alanine dehydrogenase-like protein (mu-crystallin family)